MLLLAGEGRAEWLECWLTTLQNTGFSCLLVDLLEVFNQWLMFRSSLWTLKCLLIALLSVELEESVLGELD